MSKILIIAGLVMMTLGIARVANAQDVLVTMTDIRIEAGTANTWIANMKEDKTQCILKHDVSEASLNISKNTGLNIEVVSQGPFRISVRERAREIIEVLGGKYNDKLSTMQLADEILKIGGRLSFVNDRAISEFQYATEMTLASFPNMKLSCRSVNQISYNQLMSILSKNSQFNLLQLDEGVAGMLETQAEDLL